ncbi:MAG TPA: 50S ribosomal protein L24 [Aggregatilineales bacterium]|nr:50S ribosomal protein L24 [Chloroflexota bacterium]HOA23725.1 50S ribosomal protein L24 [Aggregatilineales bacterium]HQA67201.1 50S ribosomal protein L24 [Aggregatilineales bacterium]HQE17849.1 50S ribosomal protein L24 [Aggregatilineales bacterium]
MRIKKEDIVEVIAGNDRGARGRVLRVIPRENRVVVESVNIRKKHQRPMQAGRGQVQAGIIQFEAPIHASNVMLVCPQCDKRTRVGIRRDEEGKRIRVCKECGEDID